MPMYVFQCPKCGHEEEKMTKHNVVVPCEKCGTATKRKIYASGIVWKGGKPSG